MNAEKMLGTLFRAIDGKDADAFAALLAPDGEFRFGNLPPVCGRNAVREFVAGFFASIAALTHVVEASWQVGDDLICHGRVTYTRHDGSTLAVPFANMLRTSPAGYSRYLIFADTSALYATA